MAGVVLLEQPAAEAWMQGVAADLGAPTTGFVDLVSARIGRADVRFFTPVQEIHACGHVTVAVATALAETGVWRPGPAVVQAAGGTYHLMLALDDEDVLVEMQQRLQHLERLDPPPDLVPVDGLTALAKLPLDPASISEASQRFGVDTIGVWTFTDSHADAVEVRMRDLCAGIGAIEEPASGTTTGTLAFVLAEAGALTPDRPDLNLIMGIEMGRASALTARVDFDGRRPSLVHLFGCSRLVLAGDLMLSAI